METFCAEEKEKKRTTCYTVILNMLVHVDRKMSEPNGESGTIRSDAEAFRRDPDRRKIPL